MRLIESYIVAVRARQFLRLYVNGISYENKIILLTASSNHLAFDSILFVLIESALATQAEDSPLVDVRKQRTRKRRVFSVPGGPRLERPLEESSLHG